MKTEEEKLLEARKKFAPLFAHPDDIEMAAEEYVRDQGTKRTEGTETNETDFKADTTGH